MDQRMFYQIAVAEAKEGEMALVSCLSGEFAASKALFHEGGLLTAIPREAGEFWSQVVLPSQDNFCGLFDGPAGSRLFCDPLTPEPKLVLAGAGHVSQSLAALGRECGFSVFVIDDRPQLLTEARFPGCTLFDDYTAGLMPFSGGNCYHVALCRDHETSLQCMTTVLRRRYAYAGMIGAGHKRLEFQQQLLERGVPQAKLDDLLLPVGLDIGAETPAEIAVAIMAQLIERRRQLTGGVACYIPIYQALSSAAAEQSALVTVVSSEGAAPRRCGSKLVLSAQGQQLGSVGGGKVEAQALEAARQALADGKPRCITAQAEAGGKVEVFIERI